MVYPSATQSLAALESLVHLNPPVTFVYAAISVDFDAALVETVPPAGLPSDWTDQPPPPSTMAIGHRWVTDARSAVLETPSVIIPAESNSLLNPAHADFCRIRIGETVRFAINARLV